MRSTSYRPSAHRALLSALILLLTLAWSSAAFAGAPTDFIKGKTARVSDILSKPDSKKRQKELDRELKKVVDFGELAARSLGPLWPTAAEGASKDEVAAVEKKRARFLDLLQQMLEVNYSKKLEGKRLDRDFKVEYASEKARGDRAIVKTKVLVEGKTKPIEYKLLKRDAEWIAYDIIIDDISLEETYRESYTAIIKKEGWDGLIKRMEAKVKEMRAEAKPAAKKK